MILNNIYQTWLKQLSLNYIEKYPAGEQNSENLIGFLNNNGGSLASPFLMEFGITRVMKDFESKIEELR
jgi:hypothetical protein